MLALLPLSSVAAGQLPDVTICDPDFAPPALVIASGADYMRMECDEACGKASPTDCSKPGSGDWRYITFESKWMAGRIYYAKPIDPDLPTLVAHPGDGGTNFNLFDDFIEYLSDPQTGIEANVLMVVWAAGLDLRPEPEQELWGGWLTRPYGSASTISQMNSRVAAVLDWIRNTLVPGAPSMGTMACSLGALATLGPVVWHGLDPIIDYQLMIGGPPGWDLNVNCGRTAPTASFDYLEGCECGTLLCPSGDECVSAGLPGGAGSGKAVDFQRIVDHVFDTPGLCAPAQGTSAPLADSSLHNVAAWDLDHHIDFILNVDGPDGHGDEHIDSADVGEIYNAILVGGDASYVAIPDTDHCDALLDSTHHEALKGRIERGLLESN